MMTMRTSVTAKVLIVAAIGSATAAVSASLEAIWGLFGSQSAERNILRSEYAGQERARTAGIYG